MRYAVLLLLAVPCFAGDNQLWTTEQVAEFRAQWDALRRAERIKDQQEFVDELLKLDTRNRESQRKVDALTSRSMCS